MANSVDVTFNLLRFFGLMPAEKVRQKLKDIERGKVGRGHATLVDKWIRDGGLKFDEIQEIQSHCQEAMALWGYKNVQSEMELIDLRRKNETFMFSNWPLPGAK